MDFVENLKYTRYYSQTVQEKYEIIRRNILSAKEIYFCLLAIEERAFFLEDFFCECERLKKIVCSLGVVGFKIFSP